MSRLKSDPAAEDPGSAPSRPTVAVREASADIASILAKIDAAMARSAADELSEAAARPAPLMCDGDGAEKPEMEPDQADAPGTLLAHEPRELKIAGGAEARSRLNWFIGVADTTSPDPGSLTYEPFFGLREKPFSLSSDPRFFFTESLHGAAFDTLAAAIRRREGLLVLTGEVGTGKTTLCRAVLQSLDQKTFAAFVQDPFLSREDLLKTLLVDFGVVSVDEIRSGRLRGASRTDLSYPLYDFLASLQPLKAFAVVMIDEAQNLAPELLEEIRILSDLDNGQKLLEVVLVGQPELQARMATTGDASAQSARVGPLRAGPACSRGRRALRLTPAGRRGQRRQSPVHGRRRESSVGGVHRNSARDQSSLRPRAPVRGPRAGKQPWTPSTFGGPSTT